MLVLFFNFNLVQVWKVVYFYCLSNNKYFFEQILVIVLILLKEEDFLNFGCLFDREFRFFSCLFVFLGWIYCQSLELVKSLFQILYRIQDLGCDEFFRDVCDGLWVYLEVLEWCIQQSSNFILKRDLLCYLYGGDSYLVFYIFYYFINFLVFREEDVFKFLQKVLVKDFQ